MKAFSRQRIREFSCVRKETVDIDILITSKSIIIIIIIIIIINLFCFGKKNVVHNYNMYMTN